MKNIIHFLFEVGMLKKTPRTGYQFLGSGEESVAEHSFRTAVIGYILAKKEPEADTYKTTLMCLFHDLHEGRTGDRNYVNKKYVQADEERAIHDLARNLPFGDEIMGLCREFNTCETIESRLAKDADQLDLILELKNQQDLGNKYAKEWLHYAVQRLITENGKRIAQEILETDSTDWWFEKKTELWVNHSENHKKTR
ncbi:MAG: HD domain-containing protein [Deltaproteobacteria bacterium]|nr:HD domain-containing protein [Deltaproteobacteria bacterium]